MMTQEVQVRLDLGLELPANLSKEDIAELIKKRVINSLGEIIVTFDLINIKEEGEIYGND